ncbi:MAG TPA: GrpB family protein [Dehalococcoidia bacterium]|nr:GrpB family protein [Dehalococcoidia bacterium]
MPQPIIIVDYNPQWPAMYEKEKARILGTIGHKVVAIEHIGSTAVSGLGSKPIIDIMAAVRRMSDSLECIEPLQTLGYEYYYYPEFPERCVFLDGSVGAAPHHLHMTEFLSDFWTEKLLFRDYLRAHPEAAEKYCRLKKKWAKKYGADRDKYEDYTEAKTPFIEAVLARARSEQP